MWLFWGNLNSKFWFSEFISVNIAFFILRGQERNPYRFKWSSHHFVSWKSRHRFLLIPLNSIAEFDGLYTLTAKLCTTYKVNIWESPRLGTLPTYIICGYPRYYFSYKVYVSKDWSLSDLEFKHIYFRIKYYNICKCLFYFFA